MLTGGVFADGDYGVITAGHCFRDTTDHADAIGRPVWGSYDKRRPIGTLVAASSGPDSTHPDRSDWAVIRLYRDVGMKVWSHRALSVPPAPGTKVCKKGRVTGITCGTVISADRDVVHIRNMQIIWGDSGSIAYVASTGAPVGMAVRMGSSANPLLGGAVLPDGSTIAQGILPVLEQAESRTTLHVS